MMIARRFCSVPLAPDRHQNIGSPYLFLRVHDGIRCCNIVQTAVNAQRTYGNGDGQGDDIPRRCRLSAAGKRQVVAGTHRYHTKQVPNL